MLIFNTTYLVSDKMHGVWNKWVREHLIPFMTGSNYFTQPQIAKVYTQEEQEGTSFSVQFHIADLAALEDWNNRYGAEFQKNCSEKFGTEVLFFSTVLEIME